MAGRRALSLPPSLPTGALTESAGWGGGVDLTRQGPTCQGPGNREEAFVSAARTHPGPPGPRLPHPEASVRAQRREPGRRACELG